VFKIIKIRLITVILILLLFSINISVLANSLWSDEAANIYEDRPDYIVGDIITVIIKEDASAVQSANTSTSQANEVDAGSGVGFLDFLKAFKFDFSDSGTADGQTQRSGTLEANITARIVESLDSGNFRITGTKKIKINGEEQIIKLSGIIRPEDISLENTINSTNIADASIEFEGRGAVTDKQEPGLLEKLFNFIF